MIFFMEKIKCNSIAYYFLVYMAMHGGILFLANAVYWDDWTLYRTDPIEVIDTFRQQNWISVYIGHVHNFFMGVGLWLYKTVTFFALFITAIFLDLILKKFNKLDPNVRFCVVLLFLSLPFYWARVAMIDLVYTLSIFIFFGAWLCYWQSRVLSLILFFISFTTNSLLVFYTIPFLSFYYFSSKNNLLEIKALFKFSIRHIDFILLPFIFFGVKNAFFQPYGIFEGYNQHFGIENLFFSAAKTFVDLFQLEVGLLNVLIIFFLLYNLFEKTNVFALIDTVDAKNLTILFILGSFFLMLAVFPYWILGHVTKFSEWTSRHQLLMPLGAAFICAGLIFSTPLAYRKIVALFIFSVCFTLNFTAYVSLYHDWKKQEQIIVQFRNSEVIKSSNIILLSDMTVKSNALSRVYRIYEWNGLMEAAFGDQKRIGMRYVEYSDFEKSESFRRLISDPGKYKMKDFSLTSERKFACVSIDYRSTVNSISSYLGYLKNGFPIEVYSVNCDV
jgi:hypothetical protein